MLGRTTIAKTDLSVSPLCYGTNMLGTSVDQERSNAILDQFTELGGNFIDTARSYGDWVPTAPAGASERAVGTWLKTKRRDEIVIATKGGQFDLRAGDWRNRVTTEDLTQDLTESLDHLQVDTIDLYWLHADNPAVPVGPIIDTLLGFQERGLIRYFGASNWSAERILEANAYARSINKQGFVAAQPFWGLAVPNVENAAAQGYQLHYEGHFEALHADGLPMIPYAGQSGGYFAKLAEGGEAALSDMLKSRYDDPRNGPRLAALQMLAQAHGVSVNEIALAYLLNQPHQTIPIIGATRPEQLQDSVKAADITLSSDELTQLRAEA